jgi:eukaryotic-like serine/threonine-protein kinase
MLELVDVIEYCHFNGVLHRDIKPENIMLYENDIRKPVIIDFGLTFNIEDSESITDEGQHLGNRFLYLPELRGGIEEKRDPRSDLTACCGILFYVLTGLAPTHLLDGDGAMPHQREGAKLNLELIQPAKLTKLNQLFDIAFQSFLDRRFQSSENLRSRLLGFTVTNEDEGYSGNPIELADLIRLKMQLSVGYSAQQDIRGILQFISAVLIKAHRKALELLGADFTNYQTGYNMNISQGVFENTLGIILESDHNIGVKPRFKFGVTGSEIVGSVENNGNTSEIMREPLKSDNLYPDIGDRILKYYLAEINKIIR